MSVMIDCDRKMILKLSNLLFGVLHEAILSIIEKENIRLTSQLEPLLKETDQNTYGPGGVYADIAEYLKSRREAFLFADLVKKAIELKHDYFNRYEGCIAHLNDFHTEIVKYGQELKN